MSIVIPTEEEIIERMKEIATAIPGIEDEAWNLKEKILDMSSKYHERRSILKVVVEQVELLVIFRLLNGDHAFDYFIAELYANGMAVREKDKIRKIISDEYKALYNQARDELSGRNLDGSVLVEGITRFEVDMKAGTLRYWVG